MRGRVALVTGAAGGIGAAVTERLLAEGAHVVLTDRREDGLEPQGSATLRRTFVTSDLRSPRDCEGLAAEVERLHGRLDVLVNNAGVGWAAAFGEHPLDGWDKVFEVNVRAPFLVAQALLPLLKASPAAAVVNIGSNAASGLGGQVAYDSSKGAVEALTRAMAVELGPSSIRANTVVPGMISTRMTLLESVRPKVEALVPGLPLARLGEPQEVAAAVAFLASDDARYITGQTLRVDGGWIRT